MAIPLEFNNFNSDLYEEGDYGKMKKGVIFVLFLSFVFGSSVRSSRAEHFIPSDLSSLCLNERLSEKGDKVTDYPKLGLLITKLPEDGKRIGLSEEKVKQKCELTLRGAGLEPCCIFNRSKYLYVKIDVNSEEFEILVQLRKPGLFEVGENYYQKPNSPVLEEKIVRGHHGGDPERIIQCLEELLTFFGNRYLEAYANDTPPSK